MPTKLPIATLALTLSGFLAGAMVLLPAPAMACSVQKLRGQIVVLPHLSTSSDQMLLPGEHVLQTGDLLPLFAPLDAKVRVLDTKSSATDILQRLAPESYKMLSEQDRGQIPIDVRIFQLPQHEWIYFGGARPGVAYLAIESARGNALLRVEVHEAREQPRGEVLLWDETKQDKPIHMTILDKLEIELPGRPGDGWTVVANSEGANVLSIAHIETANAGASPRTRLRVNLPTNEAQQVLQVRNRSDTYRFTVKARGVPSC